MKSTRLTKDEVEDAIDALVYEKDVYEILLVKTPRGWTLDYVVRK